MDKAHALLYEAVIGIWLQTKSRGKMIQEIRELNPTWDLFKAFCFVEKSIETFNTAKKLHVIAFNAKV